MHKVFQLCKLQMDNSGGFFKTSSVKKTLLSIFKYLLILGVASLVLSVVFMRITILGFKINPELLTILLFVCQIVTLVFAIGNIINRMYLAKDNEILMTLPVTPNQIFISKVIIIYLKELLISSLIILPIFFALAFNSSLPSSFFASIPILLLLFPILPIVIASFLSIPVMKIQQYFKKHPILSIVVILCAVAGVLYLYMSLIGGFAESFNIVSQQIETVREINGQILHIGASIPIYYLIAQAMFSFSSWYWFAVFIALSALLVVFTILLIKPFYFKIAMTSNERSSVMSRKVKKHKKSSIFSSLIKKEFLTVFRSPGYVFQFFLFTLLMPFIVFIYDKLMLSIAVSQAGQNMIAGSHLLIVGIFAMLSNLISASTISREGATFYISKTIPVNYYSQMFAKLIFNGIFTISALFLTMIVSLFYLDPAQVVAGTIALIFASIGHIALGIEMDIKQPMLNWDQGGEFKSMTATTGKSLISGLLLALGLSLIIFLMAFTSLSVLPWILVILLGLVFCIHRVYILVLRINLQYDKIEN